MSRLVELEGFVAAGVRARPVVRLRYYNLAQCFSRKRTRDGADERQPEDLFA